MLYQMPFFNHFFSFSHDCKLWVLHLLFMQTGRKPAFIWLVTWTAWEGACVLHLYVNLNQMWIFVCECEQNVKLLYFICPLTYIYLVLVHIGSIFFHLITTKWIKRFSLETIAKNVVEFSWYIWSQHNVYIKYCILSIKLCNETMHWER